MYSYWVFILVGDFVIFIVKYFIIFNNSNGKKNYGKNLYVREEIMCFGISLL